MGKAIVDVSCELLRQLLYLPYDTEVVMSLLPQYPNSVRLIIEGPQFETKMEGELIPICVPTFTKVESPSTIIVFDWGSYSDSAPTGQDPDKP